MENRENRPDRSTTALYIALDERDGHTRLHSDRVVELAVQLGAACGIADDDMQVLRAGAQFHDIGKIGIPDYILLKPGSLSGAEWEIMKTHAALGERIFNAADHPHATTVASLIRHHHENFDGNGYPDGLKGDEIPLMSRIITIVDGYDAMRTTRHYHTPRTHSQIMGMLEDEKGNKYDPDIIQEFITLFEKTRPRQQ